MYLGRRTQEQGWSGASSAVPVQEEVRDGESFRRSPLGLARLQEASGIPPIFFLWEFSCPVSTSLSFFKITLRPDGAVLFLEAVPGRDASFPPPPTPSQS